jgi:hypothetical protein
MLVLGSVAADFAPLHPADDLARCQRYYEVHGGVAGFPQIGAYASAGGENLVSTGWYAVGTGGAPTVTKNGTWAVTNCGQPAIGAPTVHGYTFYIASSGAGLCNTQPDSADDTITSEWNPGLLPLPVGLLVMQGAQPEHIIAGIALIAVPVVSMYLHRAAHGARLFYQPPSAYRTVNRLRRIHTYVAAMARRVGRAVLS